MAINSNAALDAEHICVIAGTGGGKTAAVKLMGKIGNHAAIFDPYMGYKFDGRVKSHFNGLGGRKVYHFQTRSSFAKAFIDAWRSGKKFVVAYTPVIDSTLPDKQQREARKAELHWFGRLMWDAADGKRRLHIVIEELAKMADSVGRDDSIIGEIASGGRQFGLTLVSIFQRSQEVAKTIWNNSPNRILGAQESISDAEAVAKEFSVPVNHVIALSKLNAKHPKKRLHYLVKGKGIGNVTAVYVDLVTAKTHKFNIENVT